MRVPTSSLYAGPTAHGVALRPVVSSRKERAMGLQKNTHSHPRTAAVYAAQQGSQLPPTTYQEALQQARRALRAARDTRSAEAAISSSGIDRGSAAAGEVVPLTRLAVELPVPPPKVTWEDAIQSNQESDWPGGMLQRHRYLRPLVEELLEGYDPEFMGLLEDDADALGAWKTSANLTAVSQVVDATFSSFLKLRYGEYGGAVLQADHTLLAVNCAWTAADNVGQIWERGLKQKAAALMGEGWVCIYCMEPLRTPSGKNGTLFRSFPGNWELFVNSDTEASLFGMWGGRKGAEEPPELGRLVLQAEQRPTRQQISQALKATDP